MHSAFYMSPLEVLLQHLQVCELLFATDRIEAAHRLVEDDLAPVELDPARVRWPSALQGRGSISCEITGQTAVTPFS